jgi:vancomycin resistance protein YoaR
MGIMHPLLGRAALVFGIGLLAGGGAAFAQERYAPSDWLPGLKVDGVEVPLSQAGGVDPAAIRALVVARAEALRARKVSLRVALPEDPGADLASEAHSLGELGIKVDVDAAVRRVLALEHDGDLIERARLTRRAKHGDIDVPLLPEIDAAMAWPALDHLKEESDAAAISARLDLEHRTVIPEKNGRYVDPWAGMDAILLAARDPAAIVVTIPSASFPARHTSELLSTIDVHTVLGEYDTYFSRQGDQRKRGQNIDVAATKIDGLVILPAEIVSFNDAVGERSEENGFAKSWEIFKGEMVEGVGGGTCQVASTFHAAAFFGGLDVLERLPHSRPSAYIPMGLDATVVYPIVDLKIRNPFDFPVVMHAKVTGNHLHMELLGPKKVAKVGFARDVVETFPYKRKVTEEAKLAWSKHVVLKQHGIRGYRIKRSRTLQFATGKFKKETNVDLYPPTTEIYEVPPGFDVSLLPPLPEDKDDDAAPAAPAPPAASAAPPVASAAPSASATAPSAIVLADGTTLDVEVAKGAHAPTRAQYAPPKTVSITR